MSDGGPVAAHSVGRSPACSLGEAEIRQIVQLEQRVWPEEATVDELVARYRQASRERRDRQEFRVLEADRLLAHAECFVRRMTSGERAFEVGCLAGVCVLPERRGDGLGAAVVRAVFDTVDAAAFDVVLFQTQVPAFYRRLGARPVDNRFTNGHAEAPDANPWWDDHVMIFPGEADWPDGPIDLAGPGY